MIFDKERNQIDEYQKAIGCHEIDKDLAYQATLEAEIFEISQWYGWSHTITRKEMQYLLGLRTREMDLMEAPNG